MAMKPIVSLLMIEQKLFVCRLSPVSGTFGPTNKELLLCVLGGSAVKMTFWTSIIASTEFDFSSQIIGK
jgi:hypothetical protein